MTKLDTVSVAGREPLDCARKPLVIAAEALRQLPQQRAQLACLSQRLNALQEQPVIRLEETSDMCQIPAHFHGENKGRRYLLRPSCYRAPARQTIERRIHLNGVEQLRVQRQPLARRRTTVYIVTPMRIVPAAASDSYQSHGPAESDRRLRCAVDVVGFLRRRWIAPLLVWKRGRLGLFRPVGLGPIAFVLLLGAFCHCQLLRSLGPAWCLHAGGQLCRRLEVRQLTPRPTPLGDAIDSRPSSAV